MTWSVAWVGRNISATKMSPQWFISAPCCKSRFWSKDRPVSAKRSSAKCWQAHWAWSDLRISVPEIGTIKAKHSPLVRLTSNNSREMSDALKRRCLHLYLEFPDPEREMEIIKLKVPGVGDQLAKEVVLLLHRVRKLDLKKTPSISETLAWVKA